jgi:hypothetical protein
MRVFAKCIFADVLEIGNVVSLNSNLFSNILSGSPVFMITGKNNYNNSLLPKNTVVHFTIVDIVHLDAACQIEEINNIKQFNTPNTIIYEIQKF